MQPTTRDKGLLHIIGLLAAAALALDPAPGLAQGVAPVAGLAAERQLEARDDAALERADPADRQLAGYSRGVPDVGFLRLYGEHAMPVISRLPSLLGMGASNVDYEHDASLRETLLEVQLHRIAQMVRNGLPSATLFKLGAGTPFEHGYLCVITLDTAPYRQDPAHASRFMLPSSAAGLASTGAPPISNEDFLRFTVDHEAFHCLDAYFNGPTIRKTRDPIAGMYQDYLNEARADAFASRSFKAWGLGSDGFLARLAAMRTLAVLDMDLTHATGQIIAHAAARSGIADSHDVASRVAASRALVAAAALTPDRFALRVASAQRILEQQGWRPGEDLPIVEGLSLHHPDAAMVAALKEEVRQAQQLLAAEVSISTRPEEARVKRVALKNGE